METEPQFSLGSEACQHSDPLPSREGGFGLTAASQDLAAAQQPAKKQTRQWAAWTRQEEESFFTALRQVGKNFEKITSRVQSKNKDQVRHYYYRLVRRMNKLLGPELCLDAKNSKDTNAAMLRWWSLLEKYSCKASKLHLKPRRFKIFVETLENQLLKDRKKNVKKRPFGENSSVSAGINPSNQCRDSNHDSRAVNVILVDSHNIQRFGSTKGSPLKRHVNIGVNHSPCKFESSPVKSARHRRKIGNGPTASLRKWEKAAMDGVSLVADAAEHLERTGFGNKVQCVLETQDQNHFDHNHNDVHIPPTLPQHTCSDNNIQGLMKLKLQLFPVDEETRRALEMDNHNPYLELTLSSRKRISSVLEHLNRKWGTSKVACGELALLPYSMQRGMVCEKWNRDSSLCAADVYACIGSPPVFRLRYGWFREPEIASYQGPSPSTIGSGETTGTEFAKESHIDVISASKSTTFHEPEKSVSPCKNQLASTTKLSLVSSAAVVADKMVECVNVGSEVKVLRNPGAPSLSVHSKDHHAETAVREVENTGALRTQTPLSAGEWADSLTNISIGDLLSEVSPNEVADCIESPLPGTTNCLQQIPFSCDSFDAAIAAHISKYQAKAGCQADLTSHASSIWDAEETCDAFAFQKNGVSVQKVQSPSINVRSNPPMLGTIEELPSPREPSDDIATDEEDGNRFHDHSSQNAEKDLNGLSEIYWPESLGPLDLEVPPCRYPSNDLILTDSLSGLNRLIASSLDAFQNCSFFGLDKKDTT